MDRYKLEYERKKRGVSISDLCETIGICRSSYYRKCKGESEFTQGEIQKIIDLLELETPVGIFFAD